MRFMASVAQLGNVAPGPLVLKDCIMKKDPNQLIFNTKKIYNTENYTCQSFINMKKPV